MLPTYSPPILHHGTVLQRSGDGSHDLFDYDSAIAGRHLLVWVPSDIGALILDPIYGT